MHCRNWQVDAAYPQAALLARLTSAEYGHEESIGDFMRLHSARFAMEATQLGSAQLKMAIPRAGGFNRGVALSVALGWMPAIAAIGWVSCCSVW